MEIVLVLYCCYQNPR